MSVSFFGFDTELPGESPGVHHEDDIDLLNDETFGNCLEDDDWEEQHEQLAANLGNGAKNQLHDQYDLDLADELENNISRLVVDDEETSTRAKPIPRKTVALDDLFGPDSPNTLPSLDHLVSPGKQNIWGSPVTSSHTPPSPRVVNGGLSNFLLHALHNAPSSVGNPAETSLSSLLPNAKTVTEIESAHKLNGREQARPGSAKVLTVTELERQLQPRDGGQRPPPNFLTSPAAGTYHMQTPVQLSPSMRPMSQQHRNENPLGPMLHHRSPGPDIMHQFSPYGDIRHHRPPPMPSPGYRQRFIPNSPMHQGIPMSVGNSDPSHMRMSNPIMPPTFIRQNLLRKHTVHNVLPRPQSFEYEEDEDANLMTQREKDWIIKIQLMQLQTDNPYVDDYYYTAWSMKKIARERAARKEKGDAPSLVIPQRGKQDNKEYKPVQFEGSLGRLTASSVHKPRQIIDVGETQKEELAKPMCRVEQRRYKHTLFAIEKCYDLLLEIDELEKRMLALPEVKREPLNARKEECKTNLAQRLSAFDSQMFAVQKGLKVFARSLAIVNKAERRTLTEHLIEHLPHLLKKDSQLEGLLCMYDSVMEIAPTFDLEDIILLVLSLQTKSKMPLSSLLQNQLGASLLWCFVTAAETLYDTLTAVDFEPASRKQWSQFVLSLADTINDLPTLSMAMPLRPLGDKVMNHMQRLVDPATVAAIEKRLSQLGL